MKNLLWVLLSMVATLLFVACDDDGASAKKSDDGEEVAHVVDTLYVFSKDTVYSVARDTVYSVKYDTVYSDAKDTVYSVIKDTIYSDAKDTVYEKGLDGESCSVESSEGGAVIVCGQDTVTVDNGSAYLKDTACVYVENNSSRVSMKCGSKYVYLMKAPVGGLSCESNDYSIFCHSEDGQIYLQMCHDYCGGECYRSDNYYCVNGKTYSKSATIGFTNSSGSTVRINRYWSCGDYIYDLLPTAIKELYDKRLCVGGLTYVCENPLTLTNCEYYNMNSYIVK